MIEVIWAFALVGAVIQNKLAIFANTKLAGIGKISYSYYLWHFLILYAVSPLMVQLLGGGVLTLLVNTIVCVLITTPVARMSYLVIEQGRLRGKKS